MSKNKIFYLFIIGIIIILFEGLSFIYFKIISNDDEKLLKYIEKEKEH